MFAKRAAEWDRLTRVIVDSVQAASMLLFETEQRLEAGERSNPKEIFPPALEMLDMARRDFKRLVDPRKPVVPTQYDSSYAIALLNILNRLISVAKIYYRALQGFFMTHEEDPAILHHAIDLAKLHLINDFALLREIIDCDPRPITVLDASRVDQAHQREFDQEIPSVVESLTELNRRIPNAGGVPEGG